MDRRHQYGAAWTTGNSVEPLIDGTAYFGVLLARIRSLEAGDRIFVADWRGDPDERLDVPAGTEIGTVLADAARRGVVVKGLIWRSHLDVLHFSAGKNRHLGDEVNAAGGEILLDQRVPPGGSHHQKVVLVRRPSRPEEDVAYVGGIDLGHSRRDDARHDGDPQVFSMAKQYGDRPPWHDAHVAVRGPAVGDVDLSFRERWEDPTPLSRNPIGFVHDRLRHEIRKAGPLPPALPDPPRCGPHAVQVLRTYSQRRTRYPFAPRGERSIARAYRKALSRARDLIYVEDQFFWSREVAQAFVDALHRSPDLRIVALVPRFFGQHSLASDAPNAFGRQELMEALASAGRGRVRLYDLENRVGTPVYVHAKVCIVDDTWACIGSANLNRRSWTYDSELACAILDEAADVGGARPPASGDGRRVFARDLRLQLWREHLGRAPDDDKDLVDPSTGLEAFDRAAAELARWRQSGGHGERPPGRVQRHEPPHLSRASKAWSRPIYRRFLDPDGRPRRMRRRGQW